MQRLLHFTVAWIPSRWVDEHATFLERENALVNANCIHLVGYRILLDNNEEEHTICSLFYFVQHGDDIDSLLYYFCFGPCVNCLPLEVSWPAFRKSAIPSTTCLSVQFLLELVAFLAFLQ